MNDSHKRLALATIAHDRPKPAVRDRYSIALDAALLILEEVDTLPKSNVPVRLACVIGIILDAIYEQTGGDSPDDGPA